MDLSGIKDNISDWYIKYRPVMAGTTFFALLGLGGWLMKKTNDDFESIRFQQTNPIYDKHDGFTQPHNYYEERETTRGEIDSDGKDNDNDNDNDNDVSLDEGKKEDFKEDMVNIPESRKVKPTETYVVPTLDF